MENGGKRIRSVCVTWRKVKARGDNRGLEENLTLVIAPFTLYMMLYSPIHTSFIPNLEYSDILLINSMHKIYNHLYLHISHNKMTKAFYHYSPVVYFN